MKIDVVIDVGFGDSGKGITVDFLTSQDTENQIVIRFSGGHQVGHTVQKNGHAHTFSNFGSGTMNGVPTYYSEHTTVFPPAILEEYKVISKYYPKLFLDPLVMVTTPYDIAYNRAVEKYNNHGSCGVGFGATIERNECGIKFYAQDLVYPWIMKQRLQSIATYYEQKLATSRDKKILELYLAELESYEDSEFIKVCKTTTSLFRISTFQDLAPSYDHLVFEGSQGVLLDQFHGIFPHVTRSCTTSRNVFEMLQEISLPEKQLICMNYVSRCYQNRHGNGPMSTMEKVELQNNEEEANVSNEFQGDFRTSVLDPELIHYAVNSDRCYHKANFAIENTFVLTCLDQLPDFDIKKFLKHSVFRDFKRVVGSYSPDSKDFRCISKNL